RARRAPGNEARGARRRARVARRRGGDQPRDETFGARGDSYDDEARAAREARSPGETSGGAEARGEIQARAGRNARVRRSARARRDAPQGVAVTDAKNDATMQNAQGSAPRESVRRVALASMVGTSIEWYDFFVFGTASALVFGRLF